MKRSRKASGIATCFAVVAISPALVGFAGSAASGASNFSVAALPLPGLPTSNPVISASGIPNTSVPLSETPELEETEKSEEPTEITAQITAEEKAESEPPEIQIYTGADTNPILSEPERHNADMPRTTTADERVSEQTLHNNEGDIDVSGKSGTAYIRNHSDFSDTETEKYADAESEVLKFARDGSAEVLLIHTHTTESYLGSDGGHGKDRENSVIAVADAIASELEKKGVGVIHDTTVHDEPYTGAYDRSHDTITKNIREHPTIKLVLDIHRDAVTEEDGTPVSLMAATDEGPSAQAMLIVAAPGGDGNYDAPYYKENLAAAAEITRRVTENTNSNTMRPVLFQHCGYNQDIQAGVLLIEVGSHGNTADEAILTGKLLGEAIA